MAAVLPSFLDYQRKRLKPRSLVETERHLQKNAKPLHPLQLGKIDRRTIAARVAAVASEKGGPTANRMRATLSKFFGWAIRRDCSTVPIRLSAPTNRRSARATGY